MDKLTTLFESDEQLYFCVGLIILVGAIVIICAMVNDYREYLDAHLRTRFWLREFLREEKFYFFLFFGFVALIIFVVVICTKLAQPNLQLLVHTAYRTLKVCQQNPCLG